MIACIILQKLESSLQSSSKLLIMGILYEYMYVYKNVCFLNVFLSKDAGDCGVTESFR